VFIVKSLLKMDFSGRPLHHVFKIGDRARNTFFFRTILGMKVSPNSFL
jgi:hypothetical protein